MNDASRGLTVPNAQEDVRSRRWVRRRRHFRLLVLGLALLVSFGIAELALRLLTKAEPTGGLVITGLRLLPHQFNAKELEHWRERRTNSTSTYIVADAELGWSIGNNGISDLGDSNSQGVRCEPARDYSERAAPGVHRIVAFGDSFTHGDEVRLEESWPFLLEQMLDHYEVMNFGVPGYGTDQALLRWRREAGKYHPQQALLGIWPENLCRNVNINRFFLTQAGDITFKPRFVITANGALELLASPVPDDAAIVEHILNPEASTLLRQDYWYRPDEMVDHFWYRSRFLRYSATVWNRQARRRERNDIYAGTRSDANAVTVAIAQRFAAEARVLGQEPIVMLIPMRELLNSYPGGEQPLPLVRDLQAAGITVWDHSPAFAEAVKQDGTSKYFHSSGHFTPAGNLLLASAIADRLR